MSANFTSVTEATGYKVTREQIKRMYARYRFASELCPAGARVLEIACGSGQGLGYLAKKASEVYAIDIDDKLLEAAKSHYAHNTKIHIGKGDAHKLAFGPASLDAVILYEAIYYFPNAPKVLAEAFRALAPGGRMIICSANRELPDFNPSPFSHKYYSAAELGQILTDSGFIEVALYGNCSVDESAKGKLVSLLKKTAVKLGIVPRTMRGKEWIKRILFGSLVPLPAELDDTMAEYDPPQSISSGQPNLVHKVIFATGKKP